MPQDVARHAPQVYQALESLQRVLGTTFAFDTLVLTIEALRGKPLRLEEDTLPLAITGYCIALQDVDLVCSRRGLSPALRQVAQLHELAHMLLGHISNATVSLTYAEFTTRREAIRWAIHRDLPSGHDSHEHDAELLATLLYDAIRSEAAIPARLRDVIGESREEC